MPIPKQVEIISLTDTQIGMARLDNWARWGRRGEIAAISSHFYAPKAAVCGNYLPDAGDVWNDGKVDVPVDEADAVIVERLVIALPMQMRLAVTHWYFGRPATLGISRYTLREWVEQAARKLSGTGFEK